MIKRNGVEVMNARSKNTSIAKETIDICKNGKYTSINGSEIDISQQMSAALNGTIYYPDPLPAKEYPAITPALEIVNETTAQAAARLTALGKRNLVALNFASARNQGGGFLAGAIAQEEDLCRASGLYPCLKSKPLFYNANILCDDCYYTDGIIYSPEVPFFRNEINLLIDNPFTLSIITAPAPNLRGMEDGLKDGERYSKALANRVCKILDVAALHGHKTIILGAWGCGAFGNPPTLIANMFKAGLMLTPAFEHVCFAVYDNKTPPHIFEAFDEVFRS